MTFFWGQRKYVALLNNQNITSTKKVLWITIPTSPSLSGMLESAGIRLHCWVMNLGSVFIAG